MNKLNFYQECNKIILLGNSEKFSFLFGKLFGNASIAIVSWRHCGQVIMSDLINHNQSPDLIVVCGYDYRSGWYSYRDYLEANIAAPLRLIDKLTGKNTCILYIDTGDDLKTVTYSRYRFAKNSLALELRRYGKQYKRVTLPVLIDSNGLASIYGGKVTKVIFNLLIKLGFVQTTNPNALMSLINQSLNSDLIPDPGVLMPRYLDIKRSVFLDRVLRFICG
ncbi:hypothetical protein [Polynucleobacter sp. es-MAR-4]|uniref:hypothetical protein n=1 Tax=Polynucleobacter sp. es-MAR-4 TaxID=1855655 RepID=UPI001C0DDD11|nr:hypothetical protein [Polynucleobacter sp. es-MAR-4]MBU3637580.1 hypothetical protein [Polynucleobacter sp. es-MAR-4]